MMTMPHLRKGCPQSYILVNMRTLHGNLYTYLMRESRCRMGNVWYWKNLLIEARKYYWAQTLAHIPKDKEVFCGLNRNGSRVRGFLQMFYHTETFCDSQGMNQRLCRTMWLSVCVSVYKLWNRINNFIVHF